MEPFNSVCPHPVEEGSCRSLSFICPHRGDPGFILSPVCKSPGSALLGLEGDTPLQGRLLGPLSGGLWVGLQGQRHPAHHP